MDINGRPGAWHDLGPAYEDELADPLGGRRLRVEWILAQNQRAFRPPFDVYETDQHIVIKVEIAGMQEEDFAVALDGRILHISGLRRDSAGKLAYQRMEINYGEFRVDIRLPHAVSESDIRASYDRGFLSVYVPRQPRQRRIPVTESQEE